MFGPYPQPQSLELVSYVYTRWLYRNRRLPCSLANVLRRDGHRCAYCGRPASTRDHVVPRSRGGEHSWENCVACCSSCNHRKADRLLAEIGWTLRSAPKSPTGAHWRLLSTVKDLDPAWERYFSDGAA